MSSVSGTQNDQDLPGDGGDAGDAGNSDSSGSPPVNSTREAGLLRQAQNGDRAADKAELLHGLAPVGAGDTGVGCVRAGSGR